MTQWPVQKHLKAQKHAEHQDATDIQNKLFLCFSDFSIFSFDLKKTNDMSIHHNT